MTQINAKAIRRFHQYVLNGGNLTSLEVANIAQAMEEKEAEIAFLKKSNNTETKLEKLAEHFGKIAKKYSDKAAEIAKNNQFEERRVEVESAIAKCAAFSSAECMAYAAMSSVKNDTL